MPAVANSQHPMGTYMEALQVIDDEKTFHREEVEDFLSERVVDGDNLYHVVAILGPQSSGKSTLLNGIFQTAFQVMDETKKMQTTHGIWIGALPKDKVLVLDVEGTDGREHGEDQDFERKSALFSLAIAEVLIVNIWENTVGLYHGANMSLLRTVLDVHLQLFVSEKKQKTILLFVIRDYVGRTPRENLMGILLADMGRIWDSLRKPESIADRPVKECFDFEFAFLPHKLLMQDAFDREIELLRGRFFNSSTADYLFAHPSSKLVAVEDFAIYSSSIWEKICSNKELDLPTQQELLAQYRCDEIGSELYAQFIVSCKRLEEMLSAGKLCKTLGLPIRQASEQLQESYQMRTERYSRSVTGRKWEELEERMGEYVKELIKSQIDLAMKASLNAFRTMLEGSCESVDMGTLHDAESSSTALFIKVVQDCCLASSKIDDGPFMMRFQEALEERMRMAKLDEVTRRTGRVLDRISRQLQSSLGPAFALEGEESYFEQFWSLVHQLDETLQNKVTDASRDLQLESALSTKLLSTHRQTFLSNVRTLLLEDLSETAVLDKLLKRFDLHFSYQPDGMPRIWSDQEDIEAVFKQSTQMTLDFLESIAQTCPPDWIGEGALRELLQGGSQGDELLILLDEKALIRLRKRATREFERRYVDAKRTMLASQSKIPWWIYLLLLVLGWNEIMAILSSPFYLLLVLLCVVLFVLVRALHLMPYVWIALRHLSAYANGALGNQQGQRIRTKID